MKTIFCDSCIPKEAIYIRIKIGSCKNCGKKNVQLKRIIIRPNDKRTVYSDNDYRRSRSYG